MPHLVNVSDPTFEELVRFFASTQALALTPSALTEVRALFAPPVTGNVPPAGDLAAQVKAAATAGRFDKAMFYAWDWAASPGQFVETKSDSQGPIGHNGVACIAFIPRTTVGGNGNISVSEYGGGFGSKRALSISTKPCDFSPPSPGGTLATNISYNPAIQFTVEPVVMRGLPMLKPGVQYFVNVANRDEAGQPTGGDQPEVRINATRPMLA